MEVQEDGENVALKERVGQNQKIPSLILSRWLHCKAWETADIFQRCLQSTAFFVYNLASQVSIRKACFSNIKAAAILLLHAVISIVVVLSE